MSLLTVLKVSLAFADRKILEGVNFNVERGQRIGLVGPNGAGKTTLLRILTGELQPDEGEIRVQKGVRTGYLPQDVFETHKGPLLASVQAAAPGRTALEAQVRELDRGLHAQGDPEVQERIARRLAEVHQQLQHLDRQYPPHEAEKILVGLGFSPAELQHPMETLSGGWKMRAALARLLYQQPDVLFLDEPTNHLDVPSVRWLEQFLQGFKGALVLVSHDREFLNRQINRTIALDPEGVGYYSGNYYFYLTAREQEGLTREAAARNQDQKVKEAQKFIERFRSKSTKARQAQSKIKLLKKMELVSTQRRARVLRFTFPAVARSGRAVLTLDGLRKGFGDKVLYRDLHLSVLRGERVAIIGPNGCGKTTLLKLVAGELGPDAGNVILGHEVEMSYFAQHQAEMLDPRKTVLEEVYQVVPQETLSFVRGACGAFLFSGADVEKPISVLSGGEKARVSLAKLLVKPGNFMVMDEPTNHLDLTSSEALISAMESFEGTLLVVSHNQSFVNRLATKIWDMRDGTVVEYPGNLKDYFEHLAQTALTEPAATRGPESPGGVEAAETSARRKTDRKAAKRADAERRQQIQTALRPLLQRVQTLETRIAALEGRQKELEQTLAQPDFFADSARSVPALNAYQRVREDLEGLLAEWEQQQAQLEATRARLGLETASEP